MEINVNTPALPPKRVDTFYEYLYRTVMGLWRGKTNNIGEFTIPPNATTVEVKDSRVTEVSVISFMALDSASVSGVLYVKERDGKRGKFVVGCPVNPQEQHFTYTITG